MPRIIAGSLNDSQEDQFTENLLRPRELSSFIGQKNIKANLAILTQASKQRNEPLEHILLYGPPGLGKTSLAHIISREMSSSIRITAGPAIEKTGDIAAILTNLSEGDILFIDEIHRLQPAIEEILYPAMEDFKLDIVVGQGPSAKIVQIGLPPFTLIGATTKFSKLSSPLRDRFGATYHLNFYEEQELQEILMRSSRILDVSLASEAAIEIAKRSRKTPRVANRLLRRVRDYAQVKGSATITHPMCAAALTLLAVDAVGLDDMDRRILDVIIGKFNGGPVGLTTIAAASGEEQATIEDIYEPFLMQIGFLDRTPRGRVATRRAYEHLGQKMGDRLL